MKKPNDFPYLQEWVDWANEATAQEKEAALRYMLEHGLPVRENPNQNQLGFHPAYGLSDEYRLRVLAYAEKTSVRDAATAYNLSGQAIYNWRKAAKERGLLGETLTNA